MFTRRSIFCLVATALPLMLAACVAPQASPAGSASLSAPAQAISPLPAPAYPQTFTDALERTVTIHSRPQAIVPLSPSVTEILFAIGAGDQVVARTRHDNYPSQVESLPSVGGITAESVSIETLLALEPDLVIAGSRRQLEIVDLLAETGIPVYVFAPQSLDDVLATIRTLGEMTGNQSGAQAVIDDMQARIAAVQEKVERIPPDQRVTVFYEVWHDPLTTTSRATFIGELLELAGGTNIFADLEGAYPHISDEQVIIRDPQVIVGPSSHAEQLTPEQIAMRPGWGDLAAVQNKAVYIIDGDIISRPGPRVVEALETLAAHLYPDHFPDGE